MIRVDYNVPIENGVVKDAYRIQCSIPTIKECLESGASVVLMSHLGRPNGKINEEFSLISVGEVLFLGVNTLQNTKPTAAGAEIQKLGTVLRSSATNGEIILLSGGGGGSLEVLNIDQIKKISVTESRVFISGPSGSGKELIARKIHKASSRNKNPFIVLNGALLDKNKYELELFGEEKENLSLIHI